MQQSKRIEWIDVVKGIAIILVIFAHSSMPHLLKSYIYSFHMPLFFILAGFLLYGRLDKKPYEFIIGKVKRLLVPYLFFAGGLTLYGFIHERAILSPMVVESALNGILLPIRGTWLTHFDGILWFICALLLAELLLYTLRQLSKRNDNILLLFTVILFVIGCAYDTFVGKVLPWSLDVVPFATTFMVAGYFLRKHYSSWGSSGMAPRKRFLLFTGVCSVSIVSWIVNLYFVHHTDMSAADYGSHLFYLLGGISGSFILMALFENARIKFKVLSYYGKNSLILYVLHQALFFVIIGFVLKQLTGSPHIGGDINAIDKILNSLLYTGLSLVLSLPVIWILNRFFPHFIGKSDPAELFQKKKAAKA